MFRWQNAKGLVWGGPGYTVGCLALKSLSCERVLELEGGVQKKSGVKERKEDKRTLLRANIIHSAPVSKAPLRRSVMSRLNRTGSTYLMRRSQEAG